MPDEADDVAVGVAVVLQHVHEAGAAGGDDDVVADGDRRAVLRRRPDLDADLGDVGLLAVGGRVVEDVRAGGVGVEEQLAVGRERQVEGVDGAVGRADQRRQLGDEQRVVVGVGVVRQHVQPDRLADDGDAGVVAGVGLVVGVLEADGDDHRAFVGGAEVVAHRVGQLDALCRRVRVRREHDLAGRVEHEHAGAGVLLGRGDRLEHEGVAVGVDVVGEDVERRRPAAAGRGDVVVRLGRAVVAAVGRLDVDDDRRRGAGVAAVGDRVAEADRPGVAGGRRDLHAAPVGGDVDDGVATGRLDGGHDEHVAVGVGVVEQHVDVDRAVDAGLRLVVAGDRRAVRALGVDLVGLHDLGVGVVRVDLGEDLAAVLVGVVVVGLVVEVGEDVAPVLDAVEALLRRGDPRRAGVDVVDPDPSVDEPEAQLRAGTGQRLALGLGPRAVVAAAPLGERRRARRHGEDAPAEGDRRQRLRGAELADLGGLAAAERDR